MPWPRAQSTISARAARRRVRLAAWRTACRPGSRSDTCFRRTRQNCRWPPPAQIQQQFAGQLGRGLLRDRRQIGKCLPFGRARQPCSCRSISSTNRHASGSSIRLTSGERPAGSSLPPSTSNPPWAKPCVPMAERSPRPSSRAQRAGSPLPAAEASSPAATAKASCVPVPRPACSGGAARFRCGRPALLRPACSGYRRANSVRRAANGPAADSRAAGRALASGPARRSSRRRRRTAAHRAARTTTAEVQSAGGPNSHGG